MQAIHTPRARPKKALKLRTTKSEETGQLVGSETRTFTRTMHSHRPSQRDRYSTRGPLHGEPSSSGPARPVREWHSYEHSHRYIRNWFETLFTRAPSRSYEMQEYSHHSQIHSVRVTSVLNCTSCIGNTSKYSITTWNVTSKQITIKITSYFNLSQKLSVNKRKNHLIHWDNNSKQHLQYLECQWKPHKGIT